MRFFVLLWIDVCNVEIDFAAGWFVHNDLCGETEWEMYYDSEAAEVAMKLLLAALKHCSF